VAFGDSSSPTKLRLAWASFAYMIAPPPRSMSTRSPITMSPPPCEMRVSPSVTTAPAPPCDKLVAPFVLSMPTADELTFASPPTDTLPKALLSDERLPVSAVPTAVMLVVSASTVS
jgi:hypothetical protein